MKTMIKKWSLPLAVAGCLLSTASAQAASDADLAGKNVVLVHGAFSDGSSWDKVIPLLEAKGLHVTAVQNPLTSLGDDVSARPARSTGKTVQWCWSAIRGRVCHHAGG